MQYEHAAAMILLGMCMEDKHRIRTCNYTSSLILQWKKKRFMTSTRDICGRIAPGHAWER